MTAQADMQRRLALRLYLLLTYAVPFIAPRMLRQRLARGKEHPERWQEKLGKNLTPRPDGPLIWLNAVGLGEVLSLRGLITRMAALHPNAQFLVTSTTVFSAQVFAKNLPPRTIHQFLPVDAPSYRRRFLDHFQPDLCIWVEQDIWPGMVSDLAKRSIPQCIIAARMNAKAFQRRNKFRQIFEDLYSSMALMTAQDDITATQLGKLGGTAVNVSGSLKPCAPPLQYDSDELTAIKDNLGTRTVWAVAPSHSQDEGIARAAHEALRQSDPTALLIIAPRFPERHEQITPGALLRSKGEVPGQNDPIWVFDTFGELGLVYKLSRLVLIGGTFSDIEGHNPWEAVILGVAVAHGPRTANFANDFATLDAAQAAHRIETAQDLRALLQDPSLHKSATNAMQLVAKSSTQTDDLALSLIDLLNR